MDYIKQLNAFWDKVSQTELKPSSRSIYMALLQINNRSGWKGQFKAVRGDVMIMAGIANVKTYYACLDELVCSNFIIYSPGPNQHVAAEFEIVILYKIQKSAVPKNGAATGVPHGEASGVPHGEASGAATGTIHKHINNKTTKPKNNENSGRTSFVPPSFDEVLIFFKEKIPDSNWTDAICAAEAKKFVSFYESKNWYVGKNKMVKWKSAAAGWIERSKNFNNGNNQQQQTRREPSQNGFGKL